MAQAGGLSKARLARIGDVMRAHVERGSIAGLVALVARRAAVHVDAIGVPKGRGFEGVVKRHRFAGGDSTHGAKGWHRRSGAIGQRLFPGTVMRGMRMPGHLGQVRRTTQNLEVIQVREADNLLLIKGSIPGAEGDYVVIRECKKRPKGWKPPAPTLGKKGKAAAEAKKAEAAKAEVKK